MKKINKYSLTKLNNKDNKADSMCLTKEKTSEKYQTTHTDEWMQEIMAAHIRMAQDETYRKKVAKRLS